MIATVFEIEAKQREVTMGLADINDFRLGAGQQIPAQTILEKANITLYSLDLENGRVIFVETPPQVNLSQAPFFYLAQYENAVRVLTISLETMFQLAQSITLDSHRLIFIHSVGRAGSTLASQVLAQVGGVVNISEPDALTQLVSLRSLQPDNEAELKACLDACVRLLCKAPAATAWVIKGRSFVIQLADWLHHYFPHTRNLFLYRHAEPWFVSHLRAFSRDQFQPEADTIEQEKKMRQFMSYVNPLIAAYDPDHHLPRTGLLALMWLSGMERYLQWAEQGIEMLPIRYASWRSAPQETAKAMLAYCHCLPEDMTAVYHALEQDSQAGTFLSQKTVNERDVVVTASEREEFLRYLREHPTIQSPDYEVPHTLQTGQ